MGNFFKVARAFYKVKISAINPIKHYQNNSKLLMSYPRESILRLKQGN